MTQENVKELMMHFDENKNGKIEKGEFVKFITWCIAKEIADYFAKAGSLAVMVTESACRLQCIIYVAYPNCRTAPRVEDATSGRFQGTSWLLMDVYIMQRASDE